MNLPREITSRSNSRIAHLRKLGQRSGKPGEQWLVEGPNSVRECMRAGVVPSLVAMTRDSWESYPDIARCQSEVVVVARSLMRQLSHTDSGTAVLAAIPAPVYSQEDLLSGDCPLLLLLDGLQDPGNVGTVARAGEALGATGLISGPGTARWGNSKVLRASAGALFHIPFAHSHDMAETVLSLTGRGIQVIAADAAGGCPPWEVNWSIPSALVMGSEAHGLHASVRDLAGGVVTIPHHGRVASLNVAMAATAILYEAQKQRLATETN